MHVIYSTLVDQKPIFELQGLIWAWTLTELAGVPASDLVVHLVGGGRPAYRDMLKGLGVKTVAVEPFGDGKYCNKVAQFGSKLLRESDGVVFTDADVAILEDIGRIAGLDKIKGKIVDLPRPPFAVLTRLFKMTGLAAPPALARPTFATEPTFQGNFNGGLYMVPAKHLDGLHGAWAKWSLWCLEKADVLGEHHFHADQIGFCFALNDLGLPIEELPSAYNCPTHLMDVDLNLLTERPKMLHYHARIGDDGRILPTGAAILDGAIETANGLIASKRVDLEAFRASL